jgi:hypothetical protein
VRDPQGELVCVTVYKRGAAEVVRRLAAWPRGGPWQPKRSPAAAGAGATVSPGELGVDVCDLEFGGFQLSS